MCCFSTKTEVHATKIFARLARPGTQVLAYQMQYTAEKPTAMILPLPVGLPAREDSVRFKSLKEFPTFFDTLAQGFPEVEPRFQLGRSKSAVAPTEALAVHDVGDFVASFVPQVSDFSRIDARFVLSKDVWSHLPAYADYGFAVFQLKELSGSPHPIAFEFDTRLRDTLFFPTVHIHDGTVHERDDFDHALYLQEPSFDARAGSYDGPLSVDRRTGFVRSQGKARTFSDAGRSRGLLDPELLVHRATLRGSLPNKDTIYDLAMASSAAASGCGRCDLGAAAPSTMGPAGTALAGLAWIIRRRDERRRK